MTIEHSPQNQIVASGNYAVDKKQALILNAYLGTCVGVTIWDRKAQVGGLAHLLLPEPTGLNTSWKVKAYASTGLPLFISELCHAGAKERRMEACLAGGALVGPISRLDLDLDIGGRTEEIVLRILGQKSIPILKSETGGYLSCRLSFDFRNFESAIHPISQPSQPEIPTPNASVSPLSEDLTHLFSKVRPIPQISLKVLRMINDTDYNLREIAEEIKQDQVISAGIIRLCNSTFIGMRRKIDSVERALILLGEKHLLLLVVSASLELFFKYTEQGYSLCKGGLFQHALGVALIAEKLAEFTGRASPKVAYTAGLLHDIGKVILDQYIASVSPFFYRRTQVEGDDLCEMEKEKFGYSHAHIGGLLAENWSLPENLTDAIYYHHYPEKAMVDSQLVHIVYLADLLMSRFQVGYSLTGPNVEGLTERLCNVGLTTSQFPMLVDLIPSEISNSLANHIQILRIR